MLPRTARATLRGATSVARTQIPYTPIASTSTHTPSSTTTSTTNAQGSKYSPFTRSLVTNLAKLFGYNSNTSTAIRTTSDHYDRCAERSVIEASFFYDECLLPPSFQTWFSITTLHVWLLTTRFRALPPSLGPSYNQELINHFFIDLEDRIRGPYAVSKGSLVKGYMADTLEQYRGALAAYDEGYITGDSQLAAALWRNLFGAGWGVVGGIKGKRAPKGGQEPKLGPDVRSTLDPLKADPIQLKHKGKKTVFTTLEPVRDPAIPLPNEGDQRSTELEFAIHLERLVVWIRKESLRLERLTDEQVTHDTTSLVAFSPI